MKHVLIINQHGENRGDEAAMRAMLRELERHLGEVRFTVLYQFRDRSLRLKFSQQVEALPIVLPPAEYLRAALFSAGNLAHLDLNAILSPTMRQIIRAYETADLVVSAPGGPYFGDIYANHELVHWWYVWLGHRFRKPLFLYAPSAGPFENKLLNPVRRRMYGLFDVLVTREEISERYLRALLGPERTIHVTADSAIQATVEPASRADYFRGRDGAWDRKFLVAVSLNQYKYPGASNPDALRAQYDRTLLGLLSHLNGVRDCHFLFLPQLYGKVHSDVPYLNAMAARLPAGFSWELVDPELDSDAQRAIFAMCDLHVASRYHPAIFGNVGLTPGLCIYYEHKALGFMAQLGLERYAFDIRKLELEPLCRAADDLLKNHDELVAELRTRVPLLQSRSRRTTELAVELVKRVEKHRSGRVSPSLEARDA